MTKNITTSKISSILLGFVLLSGTLAMANIPTTAFAQERVESEPPILAQIEVETGLFGIGEALFDDWKTNEYCRAFEITGNNDQVYIHNTPSQSFPTSGSDYVVLSTGFANNILGTADQLASNDMPYVAGPVDGFAYPALLDEPTYGTTGFDQFTLGISCDFPSNAKTMSFDWTFGTEENPAYLPNYVDGVYIDSNPFGTVLLLPNGDTVTTRHAAPISNNIGAAVNPSPNDTKMNAVACSNTGACSLPITTVIDVSSQAGNTAGWQFRILDEGDPILDSAMWLDNFVLVTDNHVCSTDNVVCKQAVIEDNDEDGVVEVGEEITYLFHIMVNNNSGEDWTNVVVKDNFGGELEITDTVENTGGTLTINTVGNSDKAKISWEIGDLADGESAELVLKVMTDINPGGDQTYTDCGVHDINSGANVKFRDENNKQGSYTTPSMTVDVYTENQAYDCDGDGFSDGDEISQETDPFDPEDFPT